MNSHSSLHAASQTSPSLSGDVSLMTVIGALALVIMLLIALALLVRRSGVARRLQGAQQACKVISSQSLGGRERLVLVDVGEQRLVLGVTASQITCLATQPRPEVPAERASTSSFAEMFAAMRQRTKPGKDS